MENLKRFIEITSEAGREANQISNQIRRNVAALQPGKKILSKGISQGPFNPFLDWTWDFFYEVRITENWSAYINLPFTCSSDITVCQVTVVLDCPDCPDSTSGYDALRKKYGGVILKSQDGNYQIKFAQFPLADINPEIVAKKIILTAIQVYRFLEDVEVERDHYDDEED
jgi:hypothetical protein